MGPGAHARARIRILTDRDTVTGIMAGLRCGGPTVVVGGGWGWVDAAGAIGDNWRSIPMSRQTGLCGTGSER